ncbi:MAG: hypothetical protein ACE5I3_15815, partial [Phycisphaerae bacterium]
MQRLAKFKLAVLCVSSAVLTNVSTTTGHEGDPEAERALSSAYIGQRLGVGSPDAAEAIGAIVARAAEVKNEAGQWLLPPGTTLDDVEWVGNVLEIRVTVPAVSDRLETGPTEVGSGPMRWYLSPIDVETISRAVGSPFMN